VLRRLWALVPPEDERVRWSVEGVSSSDRTRAICQAAEREGVDLVCVGTAEGSHSGGPLARELMARCRRPVMVVPASSVGREPRGWGSQGVHGG
jgi:hypothetical protein